MAMYIVTGNYNAKAMAGMLASPSDREAAVRSMGKALGIEVVSYLVTTGETDFSMVVETDDVEGLIAAQLVAGGSDTVSNLKTVQAFTSAEFTAAQKRAGALAGKYKSAG